MASDFPKNPTGAVMKRLQQVFLVLAILLLVLTAASAGERELTVKADGTFKILQMSDTHYLAIPDTKGMALIGSLLDIEKPDFVVVNGDCLSGNAANGSRTVEDVTQAISHVAEPMEQRKTPWAITFGNHDQEHSVTSHLTKEDTLNLYASHPYNLNAGWQRGLHGAGNKNLLIWNADHTAPVFAIWLIDSNDEAEARRIHADQVVWYYQTSVALEEKYGHKIPGLMFCHIGLPEVRDLITATKIAAPHVSTPDPNAPPRPRPPMVNGGLFSTVLDRGDVKGIFFGHTHEYNFAHDWMGVMLGYDSVAAYRGYPRVTPDYTAPDFQGYPPESEEDPAVKTSRGARVFLIEQSDPWAWKTWMRLGDGSRKDD